MKLTNLFVAAATTATTAMMATTAMSADIFVIGGKPDDPFWSIVKRGAEDAVSLSKHRVARSLGLVRRTTTTSASTLRS